ncbi:MAG: hypothetical protein ACSHW0_19585 [Thalassotalea sp.]
MKYILIVLGAVLISIVSYFVGISSSKFEENLCYSEVIFLIGEHSKNKGSSVTVEQLVNSLPLRGYETECKNVLIQVGDLLKKQT